MVLILKYTKGKTRIRNTDFNATLVNVVKHMICMEYNENIFLEDGSFNTGTIKPYLVYRDDKFGVTYEVTPSNGYVIFSYLLPEFANIDSIISEMSAIFDILALQYPSIVTKNRLIPTSYGSFHPTSQGMILYSQTNEHWNRQLLVSPSDGKLAKIQGSLFIWAVHNLVDIQQHILTCDGSVRSEEHIHRDLSTIFIDTYDIFVQRSLTLQFRALHLNDIRNSNRAVFSQINISQRFGLQNMLWDIMCNYKRIYVNSYKLPKSIYAYEIEFDELPTLERKPVWTLYSVDLVISILKQQTAEVKAPEPQYNNNSDSDTPVKTKPKKRAVRKNKAKPKAKKYMSDDELTESEHEHVTEQLAQEPTTTTDGQNELTHEQELLIRAGANLTEERNDICSNCSVPLYGEIFVIQSITTKKCMGVCNLCFYMHYNSYEEHGETIIKWKTIYPRTLTKVLRDPILLQAMKICHTIHDPAQLLYAMQLIARSTKRVICQRYADTAYSTNPVNHACREILPTTNHEDSERWQFMFTGKLDSSEGGGNYVLYLINDTMFCPSDYELLKDDPDIKRYIALGGLVQLITTSKE